MTGKQSLAPPVFYSRLILCIYVLLTDTDEEYYGCCKVSVKNNWKSSCFIIFELHCVTYDGVRGKTKRSLIKIYFSIQSDQSVHRRSVRALCPALSLHLPRVRRRGVHVQQTSATHLCKLLLYNCFCDIIIYIFVHLLLHLRRSPNGVRGQAPLPRPHHPPGTAAAPAHGPSGAEGGRGGKPAPS